MGGVHMVPCGGVFTWCLERTGCGGCSHGALRGLTGVFTWCLERADVRRRGGGGVHMVP